MESIDGSNLLRPREAVDHGDCSDCSRESGVRTARAGTFMPSNDVPPPAPHDIRANRHRGVLCPTRFARRSLRRSRGTLSSSRGHPFESPHGYSRWPARQPRGRTVPRTAATPACLTSPRPCAITTAGWGPCRRAHKTRRLTVGREAQVSALSCGAAEFVLLRCVMIGFLWWCLLSGSWRCGGVVNVSTGWWRVLGIKCAIPLRSRTAWLTCDRFR